MRKLRLREETWDNRQELALICISGGIWGLFFMVTPLSWLHLVLGLSFALCPVLHPHLVLVLLFVPTVFIVN